MSARRWPSAVAALGLILLVGVGGSAYWLLATQSGLKWAVHMGQHYTPMIVAIDRVRGRLIGPITLEGVRVRSESMTLRVERGQLRWRPSALLAGDIHVESVTLEGIDGETARAPEAAMSKPEPQPKRLELPQAWVPPVTIRIDRVEMTRLRLHRPGTTALRIERIGFSLTIGPQGGRIDRLEIEAPRGRMSGYLALGAARPFALDGALAWRYRPSFGELRPMAGDAELAGSLAELRLRVRTHEPSRVTVSTAAKPFVEGLPWEATLVVEPASGRAWSAEAPSLTGDARLRLTGTLERARVRGEVGLDGLPTGALRGRLRLEATARRVDLQRLELRSVRRPSARVSVAGSVELDTATPVFDLTADWKDLAWPLAGPPRVAAPAGGVRLRGRPEAYRVQGHARVLPLAGSGDPAHIELDAHGSPQGLPSWSATARWRGARMSAEGGVRWAEPGHARAQLRVNGVDPSKWARVPAGKVGGDLRVQASWGQDWQARVGIEELAGQIGGHAVSGRGRFRLNPASWRVDGLVARAGDAVLEVHGSGAARLDLLWRLSVPEVGQLAADVSGRLQGRGALRGTPEHPRVQVDLIARRLEGAQWGVASVSVEGMVAPFGGASTNFGAHLRGLRVSGVGIGRAEVNLKGTPEAHELALGLESDQVRFQTTVTGTLEQRNWSGALAAAQVRLAQRPAWRLQTRQVIAWRNGVLDVERGCWRQGAGEVCLSGRATSGAWEASLKGRAVPVKRLGKLWRSGLDYEGRFDVTGDIRGDGDAITGQLEVVTTDGRVVGPVDGRATSLLAYESATLRVGLDRERIRAQWDVPLRDGGRLDGRLVLGRAPPRSLDGQIGVRVQELGLLPALVPQVGSIRGRVVGEIALSGSLEQPDVGGDLRLHAGSLTIAPLGIRLEDVEGGLATVEGGLGLRVRASSGPGRVEFAARGTRTANGGWRAEGSLKGTAFTAADLPELRAQVSPYLEWRLDGRTVVVTGNVRVPSARIAPRDLSGAVQVSPDAVVVDTRGDEAMGQAARASGWQVRADVAVVPGDDVRVDAFGLKGRLAGSLRVIERPEQITTATGELKVTQGTYSIYRQTLTIERGRLLFGGGPLANPGLDVRAVRRPRDVVVGVNVRGTLREPRVKLFSEPPMAESQVLSYLIVGMPLGETSAGQGETVAAAASALLTTDQAAQLAEELGIDEVTVEQSEGERGASVVLGRYLSPRLYVGYGVGLLEQANSVRLRYQLTEHWSFEGRSGTASGADLLYSIEVDESSNAVPEPLRDPATGGAKAKPQGDAP